jgi:hypothetical protein
MVKERGGGLTREKEKDRREERGEGRTKCKGENIKFQFKEIKIKMYNLKILNFYPNSEIGQIIKRQGPYVAVDHSQGDRLRREALPEGRVNLYGGRNTPFKEMSFKNRKKITKILQAKGV